MVNSFWFAIPVSTFIPGLCSQNFLSPLQWHHLSAIASQINGNSTVRSITWPGQEQRKHQSLALLVLLKRIPPLTVRFTLQRASRAVSVSMPCFNHGMNSRGVYYPNSILNIFCWLYGHVLICHFTYISFCELLVSVGSLPQPHQTLKYACRCLGMHCEMSAGDHFTNDIAYYFKIRWLFCFALIPPKNESRYPDNHDDVIKWKHSPRYWPFVRGIHRSRVNSPHKGQWRGALIFSLICACINKRLSKQSWGWWYETPSRSSWRHCNAIWVADIKSLVQMSPIYGSNLLKDIFW